MQCEFRARSTFFLLVFAAVLIALAPEAPQAARIASVIEPKAASQGPFIDLTRVMVYGTDNDQNGIDTFLVRVVNASGGVLFSTDGQASISQIVTIVLPASTLMSN